MIILETLSSGWFLLLAIMSLVVGLGLYFKVITLENMQSWAEQLIFIAEKQMSTESGQEKFNYVCTRIYDALPGIIKPFVSVNTIKLLVQRIFDELSERIIDSDGVTHTVPKLENIK